MANRKLQPARSPETFLPEIQSYSKDALEMVKQSALRSFPLALTLEEKVKARMTVARCHHERSLRFAEANGRGRNHPGFREFLSHYLSANPHHEEPEILAYLQEQYPPPEEVMIMPGDAYWRHR